MHAIIAFFQSLRARVYVGATAIAIAAMAGCAPSDAPRGGDQLDTNAGATTTKASVSTPSADLPGVPDVATFSVVALDPATGDLGIAVTSKFLAVGSVVPFAEAGVGAVATQARANVTYGPRVLALLREGKTAHEAVEAVTGEDSGKAQRQLGVVDAFGRAATFSGERCNTWAGGQTGKYVAVQGNILVGEEVVDACVETFESAEGSLARRLLAALQAGYDKGGDRRSGPYNSAALLIVRDKGGYDGGNDRFIDLRADNHDDPLAELTKLLDAHEQIWAREHGRNPTNPFTPFDED